METKKSKTKWLIAGVAAILVAASSVTAWAVVSSSQHKQALQDWAEAGQELAEAMTEASAELAAAEATVDAAARSEITGGPIQDLEVSVKSLDAQVADLAATYEWLSVEEEAVQNGAQSGAMASPIWMVSTPPQPGSVAQLEQLRQDTEVVLTATSDSKQAVLTAQDFIDTQIMGRAINALAEQVKDSQTLSEKVSKQLEKTKELVGTEAAWKNTASTLEELDSYLETAGLVVDLAGAGTTAAAVDATTAELAELTSELTKQNASHPVRGKRSRGQS